MSDQPTDPIRRLAEKIYHEAADNSAAIYEGRRSREWFVGAFESILRREGVRVDGPGELWPGMRVEVTKAISGRGTLIEPQQRCWYIDHEKFGRIPIPEAHLKPLPDAAEKGEVK